MHSRRRLILFAILLSLGVSASAQFLSNDAAGGGTIADATPQGAGALVSASLIADTTAIIPGKEFTVGVVLKIKPGWHTYWQFPGDVGGAPRVDWDLPEGFKAGPIQWPIPETRLEDGDLLGYVYENEVLLPVQITVPAQLPSGEASLKAKIRWLACEKLCTPGQSSVELKLPVGGEAQPANAELFADWRARLPKTAVPFKVTWDRSKADQFSLRIEGVPAEDKLEFFPLPLEDAKPDHPKVGAPSEDGSRTVTVPISEGAAPNLAWRGVIVTQKAAAPREGWLVAASGTEASAPAAGEKQPLAPQTGGAKPLATFPLEKQGLFVLLGSAFLGGLLLNIMPCVLPVIALKIFGFVQQAGQAPERVFRLGLSFVAGVFVFFFGVAVLVIALHASGKDFSWGIQFQNPYLFAGLIAIVFVFGLNLLGVFEIALSSETTTALSTLSSREGYGGAFLHGLFTTFLGTSCTAPILAPIIFSATIASPIVVFAIFSAIAAGMSLPYFLLTARPAWMRYLPRPGIWMERAKQLTGFIMLTVAVWLLGVFAVSRPVAAAGLIHYLLALALACWVMGSIRQRFASVATALTVAVAGYFLLLAGPLKARPSELQPFSEARLTMAVQSGQSVFVDFTADWCVNCKVYEKEVLDTSAVQEAFKAKNVLFLRADWTNEDPVISKWLRNFHRSGIPLYILYRAGEEQPVVLDALTPGILLGELAKIKS